MKSDLSAPEELRAYSEKLRAQQSISKQDYAGLCSLAAQLIDTYYEQRMGIAYIICGYGMFNKEIIQDEVLNQLAELGAELEIPDKAVRGDVAEKWNEFKQLAVQAENIHLRQ